MKMERHQDPDVLSSFALEDNFNDNNSDNFFGVTGNNLVPLPTSDFAPFNYNYNQLVLNSHPSFIHHSTHQLFDFFSQSPYLPTFDNSLQLTHSSSSSSSRKRPRLDSPLPVQPQRDLARQRRQNISDKTRCLQKLMPFDKRMDTATTLEEAYKYVRFLQAQVRALSSMPLDSSFAPQHQLDELRFGGLGLLNRQQLLQVLVNSPVAQTTLCSKGFCVFSLEQLILMNKLAQAKLFM